MNSFLDGHIRHSCVPAFHIQNDCMELLPYSLPHVSHRLSKRPSLNSLITLLKRCVSQKQQTDCKLSCWPMKAAKSNPNAVVGSPDIGFPSNILVVGKQPKDCKLSCWPMKAARSNPNAAVGSSDLGFPYNILWRLDSESTGGAWTLTKRVIQTQQRFDQVSRTS